MTVYASLEQFKRYVRTDASDQDEFLQGALEAASALIEWKTSTTFPRLDDDRFVEDVIMFNDEYTLAHEMPPDGGMVLVTAIRTVEDAADTAGTLSVIGRDAYGVTITESITPGADGVLVSGLIPFAQVTKVTGSGWAAAGATDTIKVGCIDEDVPPTISAATLLQASRFWSRRNAPFGIAGSPEMGNELRLLNKLDPDVEVMLAPYVSWFGVR